MSEIETKKMQDILNERGKNDENFKIIVTFYGEEYSVVLYHSFISTIGILKS